MFATIAIGSSLLVQGLLQEKLPDGRISVRQGSKLWIGQPVR